MNELLKVNKNGSSNSNSRSLGVQSGCNSELAPVDFYLESFFKVGGCIQSILFVDKLKSYVIILSVRSNVSSDEAFSTKNSVCFLGS